MVMPTPVNDQITDAVTQTNVAVLGNAPAQAMGTVYQTAAHSLGIMFENNTQMQQHAAIAAQAATNQGVMQLYGNTTQAGAAATSRVANSDTTDLMMALLVALVAGKT